MAHNTIKFFLLLFLVMSDGSGAVSTRRQRSLRCTTAVHLKVRQGAPLMCNCVIAKKCYLIMWKIEHDSKCI